MILQSMFLAAVLLDPYTAKQELRGEAWSKWAKAWNQQQYDQARMKSRGPIIISGTVIRIDGDTGHFIRGNYRGTVVKKQWRIRQYGGGPVRIFNPYVRSVR